MYLVAFDHFLQNFLQITIRFGKTDRGRSLRKLFSRGKSDDGSGVACQDSCAENLMIAVSPTPARLDSKEPFISSGFGLDPLWWIHSFLEMIFAPNERDKKIKGII